MENDGHEEEQIQRKTDHRVPETGRWGAGQFELVVAAIASWLLAGEVMTTREWIGGAMIISASLVSARLEKS